MANRIFKQIEEECIVSYYEIGLALLKKTCMAWRNFKESDIHKIGQRSAFNQPVVLGKIGAYWYVRESVHDLRFGFHPYYVVSGKQVISLSNRAYKLGTTTKQVMKDFEVQDISKPVSLMNAHELFNAGVTQRPRRKRAPKQSPSDRFRHSQIMERKRKKVRSALVKVTTITTK